MGPHLSGSLLCHQHLGQLLKQGGCSTTICDMNEWALGICRGAPTVPQQS